LMMTFNPDRSALVERRRHFRTHPELAFQEVETSRHIAEFLESVGWTVHRGVGGTGVVAQLTREPVGASVMIRVDIDALPLDDELQAEFRSSRQGAAHACGHD